MSSETDHSARVEKELLDATRPFATEDRLRSWWYVGTTFGLLIAVLLVAALAPWWPVRAAASIMGGLLLVRAFIIFHDFVHGAVLRESRLAQVLFSVYGWVALAPRSIWRRTHSFHHANVGKPIPSESTGFSLVTSDVGAFPLMTTDMWRRASGWQRLHYRISRHPLIILFAYLTVFFGSLCLIPFLKDPRGNGEGLLAALIAVIWTLAGFLAVFFVLLLPFALAAAMGAYLFFAQHNFVGMRIVPIEQWTHYRGALESSSYMKLGPIMQWVTGNIGYHHIHHLNALIPFYRLPEAMAAIPELQTPAVTSLRPRDMIACLRLNLWDLNKAQLVAYGEA